MISSVACFISTSERCTSSTFSISLGVGGSEIARIEFMRSETDVEEALMGIAVKMGPSHV